MKALTQNALLQEEGEGSHCPPTRRTGKGKKGGGAVSVHPRCVGVKHHGRSVEFLLPLNQSHLQ